MFSSGVDSASLTKTFETTMSEFDIWPALSFNELVLGFDQPVSGPALRSRLAALPEELRALGPLVSTQLSRVAPAKDPLTDDRAPVEWLTDRALLEEIAAGGHFSENLLPTHP